MAKFIKLILIILILSSCRTIYVQAQLPEYHYQEVQKPELTEDDEENVYRLKGYAIDLYKSREDLQTFYDDLRRAQH